MQDTNELTIKSTSKYTMLTVCNWGTYQTEAGAINQPINKQSTSELTNNQPATNQQLTTNKNDKNYKNAKKKEYSEQFEALWILYGIRGVKKTAYTQWQKLDELEKDDAAKAIPDYIKERPETGYRVYFERYLSNRVFEGVLERKAKGCLEIPKNTNGNTYGKPTQVIREMPTDAEYSASETVKRDANGVVIF